jgi:hypothetical protein
LAALALALAVTGHSVEAEVMPEAALPRRHRSTCGSTGRGLMRWTSGGRHCVVRRPTESEESTRLQINILCRAAGTGSPA